MDQIKFSQIFKLALKKLWLIIAVTLIGGIVAFGYSSFILKPQYQSTASLFVTGKTQTQQSSVVINDLNAAQKLVESYIQVLNSNSVMSKINEIAGTSYTNNQLRSMIKMNPKNSTEVLEINVISENREQATHIANVMLDVAPNTLKEIVKLGSVEVVDTASDALKVSPNININTTIGLFIGFLIAMLYISATVILDKIIKNEENFSSTYDIPILGAVPDFKHAQKVVNKYE